MIKSIIKRNIFKTKKFFVANARNVRLIRNQEYNIINKFLKKYI